MGKKIALIGDLHFRDKALAEIAGAWDLTVDRCNKEKVIGVLQAGDVWDYFNIAGRAASFGTVFSAFAEPIRKKLRVTIDRETGMIIISGNHDKAGPGQQDGLVPFDGYKGIKVAHYPQVFQADGYAVACLPWMTKANLVAKKEYQDLDAAGIEELYNRKLADVLSLLKEDLAKAEGFKILLGHCELPGVKLRDDHYMTAGGSFQMDQSLLEQVGADRIVLGHIHLRQSWYLGALTQLSFGDEGNPTGFEILDTETGESEYIGIDSPRYWTFTSEEWTAEGEAVKQLPETDHIKIRGTSLPTGDGLFPAILPDNVQFEKVVESQIMTRRLSENLDPTSDPRELLKVWTRETACALPPESLIAGLEPLLEGQPVTAAAIGSLKRINRLILKNVASHQDTDIKFRDGITAITGHNGSGKTFLLEAPLAVLYGSFPSRPGVMFDYVPMGDSSLEVEFQSNGNTYRARRDIHITEKTQQQTGYLVLDEKTIAGGPAKLADFENACRELIGDPTLVMASIFSSQNQAGDLVDAKPAERKELFHKLLGLDGFSVIAQAAKDRGRVDAGRIQEIETLVREFSSEIEKKKDLQLQLGDIITQLSAKQIDLLELEQERDKILAEKGKAGQVEDERAELADKKARVQKDLTQVKKEIIDLLTEKVGIAKLLDREPEITKNLAELKELREKMEKARVREIARTNRLAHVKELEQKISFAERTLTAERKTLQEKLAAAEKQAAILTAGDFTAEACQTCQFLSGARAGAETAAWIQAQLDEIEISILEKKFAEEEQKELKTLQPVSDDSDPQEYKHITDRILELQPSERLSGQVEQVKKQQVTLESTLITRREKEKETEEQWEAIKNQEITASNLPELEEKERLATNHLTELKNDVAGLNISQGKVTSEIERLEKLAKEAEGKRVEVETTRQAIEINDTLARAFGKDGIPQLLIDSAIPQIQDILNDLLSGLDNAFAVSISTQKALKSGKIDESLDIIVSDAAGSRDISSFSGGEQKLLRTILRIALAIFQAQRAGKKLEVFFIDEAFDALDRDNAVRLLGILAKLQERFNQVFIISHTDDLIVDLPNIIRLEKVNGKTRVVDELKSFLLNAKASGLMGDRTVEVMRHVTEVVQ